MVKVDTTLEIPSREWENPSSLEIGRKLFASEFHFMFGSVTIGELPPPEGPEITFAGRSNVGKSSLLNALTNRKNLAHTSQTPGRTRQLNFFELRSEKFPSLRLVDMPGYGFAKVSKTESASWTDLIRTYLKGRVPLKTVCVLVDSRHGLKESDHEFMTWLDKAAVPFVVVLTKADKTRGKLLTEMEQTVANAIKKHPAALPYIFPTSSEDGDGIPALKAYIAHICGMA